jgi:RNA polymerase sigma-70 factor, ECF subfamily
LIVSEGRSAEVIGLHEALERLVDLTHERVRSFELRFFGGLSIEETAEVLSVSPGTLMRDWTLAKAWLRREMSNNSTS